MSFVPAPQQANAAGAKNAPASNTNAVNSKEAEKASDNNELIFKNRTFDMYWVEKKALMYKDGFDKTFDRETKKKIITIRQRSSIPVILRDMAPPAGSIFDPAIKWEEEKERRRAELAQIEADDSANKNNKKKSAGKKGAEKKKSTADSIKESNAAEKAKKDLSRDLEKLSNLRTLKSLQDTSCDTPSGKIHRMIKMLHLAVCDLRQGAVTASEAEVLDILWALEEMQTFKDADDLIAKEKAAKKGEKEKKDDKKDKKKKDKDKKDKKKADVKEEKVVLTAEATTLKNLYKEGGDNRGSYKDSLKYARKLMAGKDNLISFQLTEMADRLPPLSRYNRKFQLETWQCDILGAIDRRESAVVCAPTSSGKTLLSTYTCKNAKGTVLFVLPSEVLVWQVASTYYQFFKGNVTVCTEQITFQEITGDAQVYIGTPLALERSITKARGIAGDEMLKSEREFMILDGGYAQFDYLVLDEVHTLNGPEGDALQRLIKCCNCPVLALSATIGNAVQLKNWFADVLNMHNMESIIDETDEKPSSEVVLKEHFARFINLQRYVVNYTEGKDGKSKAKLVKLHPVAAMTAERLQNEPELVAALSMTPSDMITLWKRLKAMFPGTELEELDDPDNFFSQYVDDSKRITLNQTKEYETRLKTRLTELSRTRPELFEKLREAQVPPPLESKKDVSDELYDVVMQLKAGDLLPAVAFQLNTYGAFNMFREVLARLESEQMAEFPEYRKDLIKTAREKAQMRKVAAGKASRENQVEAEEDAKSGFTDDLMINEDTTRPHDKYVLSGAGKRLNFSEVEDIVADMKKSGETVDINHALIRGLRRGIAIYTNEVGFSCYRRQVQMLAQQGRLAVVFSDAALAYGVNMPFRSCIFCGDMGEELTPLIAQQMQGRAGRRGMDVQGNVIYLGMEWPYIENLMLGQISHVTGKEPRYPIMALQGVLAASNDPDDLKSFVHDKEESGFATAIRRIQRSQNCFPTVTESQMEWMCKTSLGDFCEGKVSEDYLEMSQKVLKGLGYIHEDLTLAREHNAMSMVWEMHEYMPTAIHLCGMLELLYMRFGFGKSKQFLSSDNTQNEFLSVLIHVTSRYPPVEGEESLQQILRIVPGADGKDNPEARSLWEETEGLLRKQKGIIDGLDIPEEQKALMHLAIPPEGEGMIGPPLDKGVYEMLVSKQKGFREDQSIERRNELKNRIVELGHICQIAHNNIQQPHSEYSVLLEIHFRRMFSNIKYCVADMMNQITDQEDLTEI
eukprot:Nitzschia sp. Nitz4//scaffold58_size112336//65054//68984//NITZ4_004039-RA/size112336-augustus-gene-0.24-mRNA-1//-1//CDS//3329555007//1583//frame0